MAQAACVENTETVYLVCRPGLLVSADRSFFLRNSTQASNRNVQEATVKSPDRPTNALAGAPRVACESIDSLSPDDLESWHVLRDGQSIYRSPFFSPEFAQSVAACSPADVRLLVARRGGELCGLMPIETQGKAARPAGLGINDAHGLLAPPGDQLMLTEMLRSAGLHSYEFHAAPPELAASERFETGRTRAFLADLTADPAGYESHLRSTSTTIDRQDQKTRKLIRKQGPLRFEFDCRDSRLVDKLIQWKSEQYRRTHTYDILNVAWIQKLLHHLHQRDRGGVHGILNVLFSGDVPVAMHYGMLDGDLLHYWFPVYDAQFGYGSPGTELFLEVVRHCDKIGVRSIDMGYGEQHYKYKLTNVITEMSYGLADESPLRRGVYRSKQQLRARLKAWKGKDLIKPLARRLLPAWGGNIYQSRS